MNNTVCPNCGLDDHEEDAIFCEKCGIALTNYCSEQNCEANNHDDPKLCALRPTALYCPYCGSKSTFFEYLNK